MAMKHCPVCGERYSDTYKECPFCEEDQLWEEEEEPRRSSRGRRSSQYSLVTPILLVLIFLMAALLVYLLYGDKIAQRFGGEKDSADPPSSVTQPKEPTPGGNAGTAPGGTDEPSGGGNEPAGSTGEPSGGASEPAGSTDSPGGVMPEGPEQGASGGAGDAGGSAGTSGSAGTGGSSYASLSQLPGGLTLSNPDFTRSVSEGVYRLRVSGGSGSYTWVSENPAIATVDQNGNVTPVAAGTVHILATDGSKKAIGIVRVTGGSAPASTGNSGGSGTTTSTGSGGSNKLNREDMTLKVGESWKLTLSGVTSTLTWHVNDSGVATVGGDGTVTGVSKGTTTVTVSWDGQSRSCIVRVK